MRGSRTRFLQAGQAATGAAEAIAHVRRLVGSFAVQLPGWRIRLPGSCFFLSAGPSEDLAILPAHGASAARAIHSFLNNPRGDSSVSVA